MTGMSERALAWLESRALDVEVCDRLGLASRGAGSGEVIVYPFFREGRVVGRKYRPLQKAEGQQRFWRDKGDTLCFFNEDCLRDESLLSLPLVITEGQDDCISVIQSGHLRCVSVPDGAPESPVGDIETSKKYAFVDEVWDLIRLDRVKEVILAVDGDSAGAALMHDMAIKLGKARCKYVVYPRAKDPTALGRERLKDMNEVLEQYGERGVRTVLERAQFIRVDGIYALDELPPLPESVIYEVDFEALSEHLKIRLGDMSVWTGIGGYGKTTLLNDILNRIAKRYDIRIGWASFEQDPQRDHRRAFRSWYWEEWENRLTPAQVSEADRWINEHHRFLVPRDDEDCTLDWLLDRMEATVVQHGCKILVIDPYNEIEHCRGSNEGEVEYTNRAIRTLRRFAKRFQIHLIIVAHPTKMPRLEDGTYMMPGLYDVNGGAVWRNKATQGVIVHLVDRDTTAVKVDKVKFREILGTPGTVFMSYVAQTRHFVETERNVPEDLGRPKRGRRG